MRNLMILVALTALAHDAHSDPKARTKAVTQADLDRLEKRLDEQQRQLDSLVALQQQYLHAILALFPDTASAAPPARAVVEPPPVAVKSEPRPVERPRARTGLGIVVGKVKGGSGETYVYIEDVVASAHGTATMKQEGRQFVPHVLAVQKGTRVDFPNLDAVFHNVFSVTPDSSFDLGSYRQGESRSVSMARPGVVSVYCNMHPEMVGYILVVPSPLYARAGQDGFFRLTNVPAGHHRIVAWAPNSKPVTIEADVVESEAATVELELKVGRQLPHTNKDGMAYGSYKE